MMLNKQAQLLINIIENQKNQLVYQDQTLNIKNKIYCYQAFENLLKQYPEEMSAYLIESARNGNFQSKIFQEYIKILEDHLPLTFVKKRKQYLISSLLDSDLGIFHGISSFVGIINDKCIVKNNTQEFFVGSRKGTITKPFYIGKILNIVHESSKSNLLHQMIDYSFNQVRMSKSLIGTPVIITHLRVPPHYQIGGMAYVNNVRKQIIQSI